ncbi:uncharacterized protein DUF4238 [Mucilaginibacter oryzae]|uniref:Uncharacterized protein DUF4238 n=1 Tax=Mucilaginibacter oryzae TaxID=468058 RepID=A0A316HAS6_9SPHI|nr:DUF4238 domain-containing protein [Mucilaginibacter oryzae]PWK77588.1 uncharacterized protein DUF4238 [Mucilaginibacter oryzae]
MAKQHQHFIPRSYLKNFAVGDDDKLFVEAKLRSEEKPKDKLISIKDICVNKNLYTIPNKGEDEKYALEDYYAREIDAVYPEVYDLLVNPNVTKITAEQRAQIIRTTMSLFFRTPKFLNHNQRTINSLINYASRNFQNQNGDIQFKYRDIDLNFNIKDIDEVRTQLKIDNKIKFLKNHLKDWHDFITFKLYSAIAVYRIYDDIQLITSDNPVIMDSVAGNAFDLFDHTNIISLPLDSKHYLTIFPNTEEAMLDTIHRADRDLWFALTTNLQLEKNCEDWIIGKPNAVSAHLADQIRYNEETEENLQHVADVVQRAKDNDELVEVMQKYGFPHEKVLEKIKMMLNDRIHKDDLRVIKISEELAKHGFK